MLRYIRQLTLPENKHGFTWKMMLGRLWPLLLKWQKNYRWKIRKHFRGDCFFNLLLAPKCSVTCLDWFWIKNWHKSIVHKEQTGKFVPCVWPTLAQDGAPTSYKWIFKMALYIGCPLGWFHPYKWRYGTLLLIGFRAQHWDKLSFFLFPKDSISWESKGPSPPNRKRHKLNLVPGSFFQQTPLKMSHPTIIVQGLQGGRIRAQPYKWSELTPVNGLKSMGNWGDFTLFIGVISTHLYLVGAHLE